MVHRSTGTEHLHTNLHFFRLRARLTQAELAARVGAPIGPYVISRYEHGLQPSDDSHVDRLASALGVTREQLLQPPRIIRTDRPVVLARPAEAVELDVPVLAEAMA